MATKTAPKTAKAPAAPKTAKEPKPKPVPFPLEEMAERVRKIGQIYHKPCQFDHAHVAVTAYCLIWDDGNTARSHSFQTYDGLISGLLAPAILALEGGNPIQDLSKYLAGLERKGYTACTVATKKGRPRKDTK
jgi:hypothetical protein